MGEVNGLFFQSLVNQFLLEFFPLFLFFFGGDRGSRAMAPASILLVEAPAGPTQIVGTCYLLTPQKEA